MKKRLFRLGALCCVAAMTITTGAQALSVEEAYDILQRSYVDKLPRAAQDAKSLHCSRYTTATGGCERVYFAPCPLLCMAKRFSTSEAMPV